MATELEHSPVEESAPTSAPFKAAIIDDAFDPVLEGEISMDELRAFHQLTEDEEELKDILDDLGLSISEIEEWDESDESYLNYLNELWVKFETLTKIKERVKTLFSKKLEKLSELKRICANLETLEIEIYCFGSSMTSDELDAFRDGSFTYLFIDYYLGVIENSEAVRRAQGQAKEIFNICPSGKKPVTILMSSIPDVESLKSRFRRNAELLEVSFVFSAKADLSDSNIFSLKLKAYEKLVQYSNIIQGYVLALSDAADLALNQFKNEIRSLGIDDYAFIQHSGLKEEKHPLGDYMAWLYGSRWSSLLFNNGTFKSKQKEVDKLTVPAPLLLHDSPSEHISNIYISALFDENIGELEAHPLANLPEEDGIKSPYLSIGDIFTKDENSLVWMVINPQCDLERDVDANYSILLVPGKLRPLKGNNNGKGKKTDFFKIAEEFYRVSWEINEVVSVPYKELYEWKRINSLERKHRLKLQFAMDIQQEFTSTLTRVGIPVQPPFNHNVKIKVLLKNEDIIVDLLPVTDNVAFKLTVRDDSSEKFQVQFKLEFAIKLKRALSRCIVSLSNERSALKESGADTRKIEAIITQNKLFIEGFDQWFYSNPVIDLPKPKTAKKLESYVSLIVDGANQDLTGKPPFYINVITQADDVLEPNLTQEAENK